MKAIVTQKTFVLTPNKDHKNFTETSDFIEEDTIVRGEPKEIRGLRRGKEFVYKLFITDKNQIIYLNKIKPMETTEVTLGADSTVSETKVNLIPAEKFSRAKMIGLAAGGAAGFAFAKYRKVEGMKKIGSYIALGALAGYVTAIVIEKKGIVVKQSK